MASHIELGVEGEERAVRYLQDSGYTILETNWRHGKEEIDIIAENQSHMSIVEVKTRTTGTFGSPEQFVDKRKQQHLINAANAYIQKSKVDKDVCFDIITIVLQPDIEIKHIKDAFYPE